MTAPADLTKVPHRGLLSLATMLAVIMQVLDTTIANVALPSMQGSLGAAQDTINWVLTSYIVASAIVMPLTGWIADAIGRNRLFLISVAGFTLASCLCGLAGSLTQMVLFRVLQGVFGASLAPLSQAVLLDINPRERHGQAMALWGAGIMVAPVLGPTLGGWLTDSFDWRWVFYINVPLGLLAFLGIAFTMPASPRHSRSFDFVGFAFLGLFVGALQLMLDRGEQLDWFSSPEIIIEAALAAAALWCFVVHSATAEHPFIHPQIFRDRNYVAASIFSFAISVVLLATTALLPPLLQRIMGFPTVTTGLVLAPRGIGTMVSMLLVGRLLRFIDPRLIIVDRSRLHGLWPLGNDRLYGRHGLMAGHLHRRIHGLRARARFRADVDGWICHTADRTPNRECRVVQSGAQHRFVDRNFHGLGRLDPQYPSQPRRTRRAGDDVLAKRRRGRTRRRHECRFWSIRSGARSDHHTPSHDARLH